MNLLDNVFDKNPIDFTELSVVEDIVHCKECVLNENMCKYHTTIIKSVLIREAKRQILELNEKKLA